MSAAVAPARHPEVAGAALDAQYDMRAAVPAWQDYLELWETESAIARASLAGRLDIAYGPSEAERLDVFTPTPPVAGAPVQILIHGGYWRALSKSCFSFLAAPLAGAGVVAVSLNYGLCPAVTMTEIVAQCRRAVLWVRRHIAVYGGDPDNIHVTGHSAGAHLAAMLAATRWEETRPDGGPFIRSLCALSGLYDLAPVRACFVQEDLQLSADEVRRLSPLGQALPPATRVLLAAGADETAAFRWQTAAYAAQCRAAGLDCASHEVPGQNHYSVIHVLAEADAPLQAAWLALCAR